MSDARSGTVMLFWAAFSQEWPTLVTLKGEAMAGMARKQHSPFSALCH